ncbi:hypothetical protein HMPREF1136_1327 [Actinomyces sp. ICM47]|nr:hypothetical protein HMPREF1136_1327 [Actinomyces sp. ICM47]
MPDSRHSRLRSPASSTSYPRRGLETVGASPDAGLLAG